MANRATGKVARIFATSGRVYVRLADLPADSTPKDGYFQLAQEHPNYDAIYSLALAAAVNRYDLQIRTVDEIVPTEYAAVQYMVVSW